MKILLILLITFSAQAKIYFPKKGKQIPYEIETLVSSIMWEELGKEKVDKFKKYFGRLDFLLGNIEKRNLFFVSKSQTFKYILKNPPEEQVPDSFFATDPFGDADLLKDRKNLNPFSMWLLSAVIRDLNRLMKTPEFREYLKFKRGAGKNTSKMLRYSKKMDLIIPWFLFFKNRTASEVNFELQEFMANLLKELTLSMEIFIELKKSKQLTYPKKHRLTHFQQGRKKNIADIDPVLETIDEVIRKNKKSGLPVPTTDWIPKEGDFAIQRSQTIQKKDPNYIPPNELPKPIDDWIDEL